MTDVPPLPRQEKIVDTPTLLELELAAARLELSQKLDADWLKEHVDPDGRHHLRPALWHEHRHRTDPELARHLRCELVLSLRDGKRVASLLDMRLRDYQALPGASGE